MSAQIANKINEILAEEFEVAIETIQPELNLKETLSLDSLDYVDLVVIVESNFGIKLVEQDFKSIATFEDFYAMIASKITNKA